MATLKRLPANRPEGAPTPPAVPTLLRADSAFYVRPAIVAAVKAGAQVSVTVRMDPRIKAAITPIAADASSSSKKAHKVRQRLQPETIQRLISDYQAGNSTIRLMRIDGIGKSTVLRLLADAGVQVRRPGLAAQHQAEAVALYVTGRSAARVGNKFGCTADTVLVAVREADRPVRQRVGGRTARNL